MFIKCVDNDGFEDQLTVGTLYQVMRLGNNEFFIKNDNEAMVWYGDAKFSHPLMP